MCKYVSPCAVFPTKQEHLANQYPNLHRVAILSAGMYHFALFLPGFLAVPVDDTVSVKCENGELQLISIQTIGKFETDANCRH